MNYFLLFCYLLVSSSLPAQIERLSASPPIELETSIGLTEVKLHYSSPAVRGRKIFGEDGLAPFGEVWRTGADWPTHISFSDDIRLAETEVPAGDYAFLVTPFWDHWSISFYPYELAGWRWFMRQEPAFVIEVQPQLNEDFHERLTIGIDHQNLLGADLYIAWENTRVDLAILTATQEQVMTNIERRMSMPRFWDYLAAASVLKDAEADLQLALDYLELAEAIGGDQNYRTFIQRSQLMSALGRPAAALEAARQALPLAIADDNPDFRILIERTIQKLESE